MGEWTEVKPKGYSPCDNCEAGSSSISHKEENGREYIKIDTCQETCETYKRFLYPLPDSIKETEE